MEHRELAALREPAAAQSSAEHPGRAACQQSVEHRELAALDPEAARGIPPGNIQRVIRAIEITRLAGRPVSQIWSGKFFDALPAHEGKFFFLKWQKDLLAERVKRRTAERFDHSANCQSSNGNIQSKPTIPMPPTIVIIMTIVATLTPSKRS